LLELIEVVIGVAETSFLICEVVTIIINASESLNRKSVYELSFKGQLYTVSPNSNAGTSKSPSSQEINKIQAMSVRIFFI
jgi:hypothetical protein